MTLAKGGRLRPRIFVFVGNRVFMPKGCFSPDNRHIQSARRVSKNAAATLIGAQCSILTVLVSRGICKRSQRSRFRSFLFEDNVHPCDLV